MSDLKLTPTQDLFMELLAARTRLGEQLWTYGSEHTRTAKQLAALGLINWKSGIVEKTIRAWFTQAGRETFLDTDYVPPILKELKPVPPDQTVPVKSTQSGLASWDHNDVDRLRTDLLELGASPAGTAALYAEIDSLREALIDRVQELRAELLVARKKAARWKKFRDAYFLSSAAEQQRAVRAEDAIFRVRRLCTKHSSRKVRAEKVLQALGDF